MRKTSNVQNPIVSSLLHRARLWKVTHGFILERKSIRVHFASTKLRGKIIRNRKIPYRPCMGFYPEWMTFFPVHSRLNRWTDFKNFLQVASLEILGLQKGGFLQHDYFGSNGTTLTDKSHEKTWKITVFVIPSSCYGKISQFHRRLCLIRVRRF